jgi:hypothetical protein
MMITVFWEGTPLKFFKLLINEGVSIKSINILRLEINECRAVVGIIRNIGTRSTRRKPALEPLKQPQIH